MQGSESEVIAMGVGGKKKKSARKTKSKDASKAMFGNEENEEEK